jgi:hypothetical protein
MIVLYCRARHGGRALCPTCSELAAYARQRLERCPFQADKPTCVSCPVHCYSPTQREAVRQVMRWAGPRMLLHHPILALRHLLDERSRRGRTARL